MALAEISQKLAIVSGLKIRVSVVQIRPWAPLISIPNQCFEDQLPLATEGRDYVVGNILGNSCRKNAGESQR